jgi:hypothetical protein
MAGLLLAMLSVGCATAALTPVQSGGLKEAQRFADEVTDAYHAQPVKVRALQGRSFDPTISWGRHLSIAAVDLDRSDLFEKMTLPLAWATLGYIPDSPTAAAYRREYLFDLNRRAVELSVKYLGITTRHAVETNADRLLTLNERLRKGGSPTCESDWNSK